jgi:hypothetical protein
MRNEVAYEVTFAHVKATLATVFLSMLFCASVSASPLLHCEMTYAGNTHILETAIGGDPYKAESIDIDGRFRFKAVVLGTIQKIETVKLYAYYVTGKQPVLIEEVRHDAPFAMSDSPYALTGLHMLYAPPLGRELQYGCALREVKP